MKFNKVIVSLIVFVVFSVSLLYYASSNKPVILGDGFEYLGMTVSLSNHLTPDLTLEDSKIKKQIATDNKINIQDESLYFGYYQANNNKMYSYHFWFFSLLCLPAFLFLKMFHLNVLNFFMVTNALLIILGVGWTVFSNGVSTRIKAWMLLMFLVSPVWFYFTWSHPEVFSFVFVYIGLFELLRNKKKTACLITGLASLQNPAIALIPAYIVISELIRERKLSKNVILTGLSSSIVVFPYLWFYWHYHVFSIIAKVSTGGISLDKAINLFLDPNMGLIFYIPILCIALVYRVFANDRTAQIWTGLLIMMALVCSVQGNWNSGMYFINRYGVWLIPVFIFALTHFIAKLKFKKYLMFSVAAWSTTGAITLYCFIAPFFFLDFSPAAKWIISKAPGIYNPPFDVFIKRSVGTENYSINDSLPIVYMDEQGEVRKSLTSENGELKYTNGPINLTSDKLSKVTRVLEKKDIFNDAASFSFIEGWEGPENWGTISRWMNGHAKLVLLQNNGRDTIITMNMGSFLRPRETKIIINGNVVYNGLISTNDQQIQFTAKLSKVNIIEFDPDGSDSLADLKLGADTRKLSVYANNISIQ